MTADVHVLPTVRCIFITPSLASYNNTINGITEFTQRFSFCIINVLNSVSNNPTYTCIMNRRLRVMEVVLSHHRDSSGW